MLKKFYLIALFFGILSIYSCSTVKIDSLVSKNVTLSRPDSSMKIVGHFKDDVRYWFTLGGLVNMNHPKYDKLFVEQMMRYNGDGICNLRLTDQFSGTDLLIEIGVEAAGYLIGMGSSGTDKEKALNSSLYMSVASFLISSRTLYLEGDVYRKELWGK